MSGEQIGSAIILVLLIGALLIIPLGIAADARDQRAHEAWQDRFHQWLADGMRGPPP